MLKRTNQDWREALRGEGGYAAQLVAHEELATHLRQMAYNYLRKRQAKANPYVLVRFASEELVELAHDCTQDTFVKLADNNFALLDYVKKEGRFVSWATSIVINEVRQELRKPNWNRRAGFLPDRSTEEADQGSEFELFIASDEMKPDNAAIALEVTDALKACLGKLKENQRQAFLGLEVEGRSGEELAALLNRPSANAVYLVASRTRRKLRKCLQKKGWHINVLQIFKK